MTRTVFVGIVLTVALVGSACSGGRPSARGLTPALAPTKSANSTPSPASTAAWPQRLIERNGGASLASIGTTLYFQNLGQNGQGPAPVVSIGEGDLRPIASSRSLPAGHILIAGTTLWLLTRDTPFRLYQLDPRSLAVQRQISLPSSPSSRPAIAGDATGRLWIADGRDLDRVDTHTGSIVLTVSVPLPLTALALDGRGILYDVALGPSGGFLQERDSATAALSRSVPINDVVGSDALAAVSAGVWDSYSTGMSGGSVLFSTANLAIIGPPESNPPGLFYYGMGTQLAVTAGVLWVSAFDHTTCADPLTGRVRMTEPLGQLTSQAISHGHELFAETTDGLAMVFPPESCWS